MTFYAYLPTEDGREPIGTSGKILRHDLKDEKRFIRVARNFLGDRCVVVVNRGSFYRSEDDKIVYDGRK